MRSRSARGARRSTRPQREHGATLVETALIIPILFTLIFGIMETGSLLKSYTAASNLAGSGSRMGSVVGNNAMADQLILNRIAQDSQGLPAGEIEYIIFWKATGANDSPPAACRPTVAPTVVNTASAGMAGCTRYDRPTATGGAFDMADPDLNDGAAQPPAYYFGCTGTSGPSLDPGMAHKVDCNWPAKDRKVTKNPRCPLCTTPTYSPPDYIGVYIRAKHSTITGVLGDSFTITDKSIALIEPQGYSTA